MFHSKALFLLTLLITGSGAFAAGLGPLLTCNTNDSSVIVTSLPEQGVIKVELGGKTKSYLSPKFVDLWGNQTAKSLYPGFYEIDFLNAIVLDVGVKQRMFSVIAIESRPENKFDYLPFELAAEGRIRNTYVLGMWTSFFRATLVTEDPRLSDGTLLPELKVNCSYVRRNGRVK